MSGRHWFGGTAITVAAALLGASAGCSVLSPDWSVEAIETGFEAIVEEAGTSEAVLVGAHPTGVYAVMATDVGPLQVEWDYDEETVSTATTRPSWYRYYTDGTLESTFDVADVGVAALVGREACTSRYFSFVYSKIGPDGQHSYASTSCSDSGRQEEAQVASYLDDEPVDDIDLLDADQLAAALDEAVELIGDPASLTTVVLAQGSAGELVLAVVAPEGVAESLTPGRPCLLEYMRTAGQPGRTPAVVDTGCLPANGYVPPSRATGEPYDPAELDPQVMAGLWASELADLPEHTYPSIEFYRDQGDEPRYVVTVGGQRSTFDAAGEPVS